MSHEIRKPDVYFNLKDKTKKVEKKKNNQVKQRPGMSEEHLILIRQLPCCVCGSYGPNHAHHIKQGTGERGMGQRSSDKWAVPLCFEDHINGVEKASSNGELAWFAARGIQPLELARALWANTGDLKAMLNIIKTHREG